MSAIFSPPLSTQRYCWVQDFLAQDQSIKSVTDVGCGHGRMLFWLKHVSNLEQINCIDCSLTTIEDGIDSCFQPNLFEMLLGRKNSDKQLNIHVYHGDIVVPDDRLKSDCFTMVEVIEHIPLDHVEKMCQTVFGYYNPRFIVVTTPNSEFNPLLKTYSDSIKLKREQERRLKELDQQNTTTTPLGENNTQAQSGLDQASISQSSDTGSFSSQTQEQQANRFRHYDHKFEWNRAEFAQWAEQMCKTYSYDVLMSGVGHLPGSEPLGPCTQIALFRRKEPADANSVARADVQDPTLCFDLFLNKLTVQEEVPEFLGDPTLRKVCLRSKFHIPGTPACENDESNYSARWDDLDDSEMTSGNEWSTCQATGAE